jgi:hypothetical protein
VETLNAQGISAPKEWTDLRQRFSSFIDLGHSPLAERLANEVVSPTGLDIPTLRALAYAELSVDASDEQLVLDILRASVHQRFIELYKPVAHRHCREVARRFNDIADRLSSVARCAALTPKVTRLSALTRLFVKAGLPQRN